MPATSRVATGRAPEILVGLAVAAVGASALICVSAVLLGSRPVPTHALGYVLASVVPFTLVAVARRGANDREFEAGIPLARLAKILAFAVLAAGLLLAVAHAFYIARRYG